MMLSGSHRRHVFEARRDLDHRLVDHDGDGIQVGRDGLQAEALRLEWDRTATGERIEERRQLGIPPADFRARFFQHLFIVAVLPLHELFHDAKEPLALRVLLRAVVAKASKL